MTRKKFGNRLRRNKGEELAMQKLRFVRRLAVSELHSRRAFSTFAHITGSLFVTKRDAIVVAVAANACVL